MCYRKGFTLIELLVVVLIIGILAAIALPQYKKAVVKARRTEAVAIVRSVKTSLEAFYMANGYFPPQEDFEDMVDFPNKSCELTAGTSACRVGNHVMEYLRAFPGRITFYVLYGPGTGLNISSVTPSVGAGLMMNSDGSLRLVCAARRDDALSEEICRSISNGGEGGEASFAALGSIRSF